MREIHTNLFLGNLRDCDTRPAGMKTIHACKIPCHQRAVGYTGNLNPSHPNYLIKENENDLYLNIVDMKIPLLHKYAQLMLSSAINFVKKNIDSEKVFIHCNQAESRAPSICLLYLAKNTDTISNSSFNDAYREFKQIYPEYSPAYSISSYLDKYWNYY